LVANGPLTTQFSVYENFYTYSGGVIDSVSGNITGAHAVLIVGWGDDSSNGKPYWNIMNSWGDTWGESGYFRFLRGSSLAGIEDSAMSMTISHTSTKTTSNDRVVLKEPEKPGGWAEIHLKSDSVKLSMEALHQHWRSTETYVKEVSLVKAFSQVIAGLHVELHLAVDSTNMTALVRKQVQGSGLTTSGFEIVKLQEIPANTILI
jgi:cathepsin B